MGQKHAYMDGEDQCHNLFGLSPSMTNRGQCWSSISFFIFPRCVFLMSPNPCGHYPHLYYFSLLLDSYICAYQSCLPQPGHWCYSSSLHMAVSILAFWFWPLGILFVYLLPLCLNKALFSSPNTCPQVLWFLVTTIRTRKCCSIAL